MKEQGKGDVNADIIDQITGRPADSSPEPARTTKAADKKSGKKPKAAEKEPKEEPKTADPLEGSGF